MDFRYTKEQNDIRMAAQEFAAGEMAEDSQKWDEDKRTPDNMIRKAAELGFVGMALPEDLDGAGFGLMEECLVIEAFSAVSAGAARAILEPGWGVEHFPIEGLPEPLHGVAEGNVKLGLAVPSRPLQVTTGDPILRVQVEMVAAHADFYLLFAIKDGEEGFFVVPSQTQSLGIIPLKGKLGLRAWAAADMELKESSIMDLSFVSSPNGFVRARAAAAIRSGAQSIGLASGATQHALKYAQNRRLFDQTLADFEGTKEKLFLAWETISAARLLNLSAAAEWDKGGNGALTAGAALNRALTVAQEVTDVAVQLHGGYGYFEEMKVAMAYRDAKMLELISQPFSITLQQSWSQLSNTTTW